MKPIHTVILTSRNRVGGTHGDCHVEIKENLLKSHKKYVCKVKWIHLSQPTAITNMRSMYITVDGLYLDDEYHNTETSRTPFVMINTSDWKSVTQSILFEPHEHLRTVRVNQNLLRFRFFDAEQNLDASSLITGWMIELQFIETEE